MGDKSAIEWTDATWNPVTGCTKISTGCKFCYAERITERWGQDFGKIVLHPDRLDQPLRWRKPRRVFVNSMSDLFHGEIPDGFIERVFDSMLEAPQHIYQILTKRPERMKEWITQWLAPSLTEKMLENIWLGVSAEDQPRADERIPLLLQTPAEVRFVSLEPLLGLIDLQRPHGLYYDKAGCNLRKIDWCIVGGESGGPVERRLGGPESIHKVDWIRSIRDQCVSAGIPFFFKQWGGPTPKSGGRLLDGRTWDEMPEGKP